MISSRLLTLRSSVRSKRHRAAPPMPRVGDEASGAGSLGAFRARVSTVPLQSQSNASRFWILLLLSSGAFEHEMIELGQRLQSLRRRGFGTLAAPVLEEHLDPEGLFKFANLFALAGWVALVTGIVTNRPWLRDRLARMYWPLAISAGYTLAIAAGWSTGKGGFFSLADVRQLFANDWFLLAGWMHYLAFDLFIAALVAAEAKRANLAPLALVPVLPLVFLFGPLGFLLFQVVRFTGQRRRTTNE